MRRTLVSLVLLATGCAGDGGNEGAAPAAGVTHTVTADGGAFRSGELEDGDEFSYVFRTAGTFAYHCAIHPDMRGTVKVGR